jgi:hypothetical protein
MKPFYHSIICLALLSLVTAGCNTNKSTTKCGPCPLYPVAAPNIAFRVVDKTTNLDLFFGSSANYKISDLKMYHVINGKPDSIILNVDSVDRYFRIFVIPEHMVDTVTMQIANKPQDVLLFTNAVTGGCCSRQYLSSVSFNGTVVYTNANGPSIIVLAK